MCYLVCKVMGKEGCIAVKTEYGAALAQWKTEMYRRTKNKHIQLVTISRPSAYGEYAPYQILSSKEDFEAAVFAL